MYVDPRVLVTAAIELEAAAGRLRAAVTAAAPTLRALPAGAEEVSASAAQYFDTASDGLTTVSDCAVHELTEAAATLRRTAAAYELEDQLTKTDLAAAAL